MNTDIKISQKHYIMGDLKTGDIFVYKGVLFMKIVESLMFNGGDSGYVEKKNAVCLYADRSNGLCQLSHSFVLSDVKCGECILIDDDREVSKVENPIITGHGKDIYDIEPTSREVEESDEDEDEDEDKDEG